MRILSDSTEHDGTAAELLDLQQQVAERIVHLRSQFQEAAANYSVRVQGTLAEVGDTLLAEDVTSLSAGARQTRMRALQEALRDLAALDLKPAKGRRRDLKAVQAAANRLRDHIAEW